MSCLMAGAVMIALASDHAFTLEWTHSVEKTEWRESWRLKDNRLHLVQAAIKGSGAGMEPGQGGYFDGDWWVWTPETPPVKELVMSASGATISGWRLCGVECVTLGGLPDQPVILKPCPAG